MLIDKFTKPIVLSRGENAAYEFVKAILKEYRYFKKVLRGYDSHLISCELNNFDVKIDIIPNSLEKCMPLFFKKT